MSNRRLADLPKDPGKRDRTENGIPIVPALDGLRWLAVVGVIAGHVWGASQYHLFRGTLLWAPLSALIATFDCFFIISGFVMFLPAAASEGRLGNLRGYAIRRVTRIFPAYWVSLVVVLAIWPLLVRGHPSTFSTFGGKAVLTHFSVLQTEALLFPSLLKKVPLGFGVNGAIWTLSVEVIFYAALPLVAMRFYRRPVTFLVLALAVSAIFRLEASQIASGWLHLLGYPATSSAVTGIAYSVVLQFPAYVGDFAMGMFCAWAMVRLQRRPLGSGQSTVALAVSICALALLIAVVPAPGNAPAFHKDAGIGLLVSLLLGAFILGVTLAPARATRLLTNGIIGRLADLSYGTYLYHGPLILLGMFTLGIPTDPSVGSFLLLFGFALIGAIVLGWLSYVTIEVPLRERGHRLAKRVRRAPARPAVLATEQAQ